MVRCSCRVAHQGFHDCTAVEQHQCTGRAEECDGMPTPHTASMIARAHPSEGISDIRRAQVSQPMLSSSESGRTGAYRCSKPHQRGPERPQQRCQMRLCLGQPRWCAREHLCVSGPPDRLACSGRRVSGVEVCETEQATELEFKQSQKAMNLSEKHGPGELECIVEHPAGGMVCEPQCACKEHRCFAALTVSQRRQPAAWMASSVLAA